MKNKDMLFTLGGIALMGLIIFGVWKSRQPEPVTLDFSDARPLSDEHKFVQDVLFDPDALAASEEATLAQSTGGEPVQDVVPLPGASLPVAWESQPAPTADRITLSPALQSSFAASERLRAEKYTDPDSAHNLQAVEGLRKIRQSRNEK